MYLVFKGGEGYLFNLISWKLIFPAGSEERLTGDVNADGTFDVLDLVLLQEWLLAIPDVTLDDPDAGDLDGNEALDVFDLGLMKRELLAQET
ncbi:MAG: hypothetical protein K5695_11850 [Oscillospiraceae bacterium]|nr:hypothetical protein [Oscillospiraceae bacterium]